MANPVVHFEIGAADHQSLGKFYGELFGWGLRAVLGGVHAGRHPGGWGGQRGDREERHRGALGDLLCRGGRPAGVPRPGRGARGAAPCCRSPRCLAWPLPCSTTRTGCWSGWSRAEGHTSRSPAVLGRGRGGGRLVRGAGGRRRAVAGVLRRAVRLDRARGRLRAGQPGGRPGHRRGDRGRRDRALGDRVRRRRRRRGALARAETLGGTRVYGPIQAGEQTRTGAFRDPAGNVFGVYHRAAS